ncbi:MAG TPA: hypothetical protein VMM57_00965 [Bacteroidota bacterium]|nr:hypothetical protein [Bacteroidota bacterium]
MAKPDEEKPMMIRCPNCKQVKEPSFNETTHRYTCPVCSAPVDAQVFIEKKKRSGGKEKKGFGGTERW